MTYTIEDNHITEQKQIFDRQGLSYHLELLHSFDENRHPSSLIINLYRDYRNCQVGRANCLIESPEKALLGDIEICDNLTFNTINDKIYRLLNWNEPINYQKRGLGTILLQEIINFAKACQIKQLHGSLTQEDLNKNSNLIQWYKKHGFQIEDPTLEEVQAAVYRACLYLK